MIGSLTLPLLRRSHLCECRIVSLLHDVAKVDDPLQRHDLVHVVDTQLKVEALLKVLDALHLTRGHILLEFEGNILPKVPLDHVWEGVWQLGLRAHDSSNQACTAKLNILYLLELDAREAFVDEGVQVELEIHPEAFHDVGGGHAGMQLHPVDVVLRIRVELSTIEDQPPPLPRLVEECHLEVERLLVEDLALDCDVGLDDGERVLARIPWRRPSGVLVEDVGVALHRLVIGLLQRALREPLVERLLLGDVQQRQGLPVLVLIL